MEFICDSVEKQQPQARCSQQNLVFQVLRCNLKRKAYAPRRTFVQSSFIWKTCSIPPKQDVFHYTLKVDVLRYMLQFFPLGTVRHSWSRGNKMCLCPHHQHPQHISATKGWGISQRDKVIRGSSVEGVEFEWELCEWTGFCWTLKACLMQLWESMQRLGNHSGVVQDCGIHLIRQ